MVQMILAPVMGVGLVRVMLLDVLVISIGIVSIKMTDAEKLEAIKARLNSNIQWCEDRLDNFRDCGSRWLVEYLATKQKTYYGMLAFMEELDNV